MLLHRNDDRQVEVNSKTSLLNRSFHTKTCHSRPDASFLNTNKLNRCISVTEGNDQTKKSRMQAQHVYTADFSGLPTGPAIVSQWDRRHKVDNATRKQCTKTGIAHELDNQSENMVSDGNCRLQRGDKTAHLAGEEEQEIPLILMEGNHTAKCSRVL